MHKPRVMFLAFYLIFHTSYLFSFPRTVGLLHFDPRVSSGYILFSPLRGKSTYLINNHGFIVQEWKSKFRPGLTAHLLENGHLIRAGSLRKTGIPRYDDAGGVGGVIEEFDWDGNLIWRFRLADIVRIQHHDIEIMPDGNILLICWDVRSADECIARGRRPDLLTENEVWTEVLLELKPIYPDSAEIVWEWRLWDHLIQDYDSTKQNFGSVAEHPELLDFNCVVDSQYTGLGSADWNHGNALDYHPKYDQIMFDLRHQGEFIVIDHSTTTAEARGHSGGNYGRGGDILYRWGNPESYRAGDKSDRRLYGQHDAHWIDPGLPGEGHILIFNNGRGAPQSPFMSSVIEIIPPVTSDGEYVRDLNKPFGPQEIFWDYAPKDAGAMYSAYVSSAQRLPNGNTLICSGWEGYVFEVDYDRNELWRYGIPVTKEGIVTEGDVPRENHVFNAIRYLESYPAFLNRDLSPKSTVENYPAIGGDLRIISDQKISAYRNPFTGCLELDDFSIHYQIFDTFGNSLDSTLHLGYFSATQPFLVLPFEAY